MSDEKWEKMEYWEIKIHKRIEELEERDLQLREIIRKWNDDIHWNTDQLKDLKEVCRLINNQKNTNREVLRELINDTTYPPTQDRLLIMLDIDTNSPEFKNARGLKSLSPVFLGFKTEKKEVGFDGFLGSNEARKEHLKKDSGGEKLK